MSRRALKAINWASLAERIPEAEKANFTAFKSKSDKYLQRMMAFPEALPQIDWSYYKKAVITPGLVDDFQKKYESISIPYPEDKYTAEIDVMQKNAAAEIEKFIQQVDVDIADMKKEQQVLKDMIPFAEMTMEDYRDVNPEGFLRTDIVTTWPHTDDSQEDLNEEDTPTTENGH